MKTCPHCGGILPAERPRPRAKRELTPMQRAKREAKAFRWTADGTTLAETRRAHDTANARHFPATPGVHFSHESCSLTRYAAALGITADEAEKRIAAQWDALK